MSDARCNVLVRHDVLVDFTSNWITVCYVEIIAKGSALPADPYKKVLRARVYTGCIKREEASACARGETQKA